jgi:hypothetical protein
MLSVVDRLVIARESNVVRVDFWRCGTIVAFGGLKTGFTQGGPGKWLPC